MNFFLHINKSLIFFIGIVFVFLFIILLFTKQISLKNIELKTSNTNLPSADISKPKFAINNESKKIFITAQEGNFLNKDEVLLKNNVRFKSSNFSIETERVIFNRNKQTAQSNTKSLFTSENTMISSEGFDINDKGNRINFYGNSLIVLK